MIILTPPLTGPKPSTRKEEGCCQEGHPSVKVSQSRIMSFNSTTIPRQDRWSRLKKQVGRLRVVSWNVGTMTGKAMEIADVLRRRKVDIACVQEVKWKGSKARNVGHGYKLFYHGDTSNRNGVGIILREERTKVILEISRISDRIILLKLACPNTKEVTTIISAYAPQQRLPDLEKYQFYEQLETVTRQAETVIIGGDLNGHVGMDGRESTSHGNIGLGERNEEGDRVVEFANTFDLVIANTWFTKTRSQLITFKSGNSESQIDYILTNRRSLTDIINCKTIPGEAVVLQHRLVVMDLRTRTQKKRQYQRVNEVKVKWWILKYHAVADDYANDVIDNMEYCEQPEWTIFSETVKEKGSEHCGVTTGGKSMQKRETWWWNTTVQEAIARKKRMFKKWQQSKAQEDHATYKEAKRDAKRTVAVERASAAQELYDKLDTRESENAIYRLAKSRDQATKDNYQGYFVKAQDGTLLLNTEENISRWAEYFRDLLNKARQHIDGRDEPLTDCPLDKVTCEEVERQLNKMKNGRSCGPDGIPTEALKLLGDWGVRQLTIIFNAIMQSGKMPDEWRESTITPIYKDKGDHMNCTNYRGIKLLSHTMGACHRPKAQGHRTHFGWTIWFQAWRRNYGCHICHQDPV